MPKSDARKWFMDEGMGGDEGARKRLCELSTRQARTLVQKKTGGDITIVAVDGIINLRVSPSQDNPAYVGDAKRSDPVPFAEAEKKLHAKEMPDGTLYKGSAQERADNDQIWHYAKGRVQPKVAMRFGDFIRDKVVQMVRNANSELPRADVAFCFDKSTFVPMSKGHEQKKRVDYKPESKTLETGKTTHPAVTPLTVEEHGFDACYLDGDVHKRRRLRYTVNSPGDRCPYDMAKYADQWKEVMNDRYGARRDVFRLVTKLLCGILDSGQSFLGLHHDATAANRRLYIDGHCCDTFRDMDQLICGQDDPAGHAWLDALRVDNSVSDVQKSQAMRRVPLVREWDATLGRTVTRLALEFDNGYGEADATMFYYVCHPRYTATPELRANGAVVVSADTDAFMATLLMTKRYEEERYIFNLWNRTSPKYTFLPLAPKATNVTGRDKYTASDFRLRQLFLQQNRGSGQRYSLKPDTLMCGVELARHYESVVLKGKPIVVSDLVAAAQLAVCDYVDPLNMIPPRYFLNAACELYVMNLLQVVDVPTQPERGLKRFHYIIDVEAYWRLMIATCWHAKRRWTWKKVKETLATLEKGKESPVPRFDPLKAANPQDLRELLNKDLHTKMPSLNALMLRYRHGQMVMMFNSQYGSYNELMEPVDLTLFGYAPRDPSKPLSRFNIMRLSSAFKGRTTVAKIRGSMPLWNFQCAKPFGTGQFEYELRREYEARICPLVKEGDEKGKRKRNTHADPVNVKRTKETAK